MTLLLHGREVTSVHWYVGHDGGNWARYTCINCRGNGVGGTISEAGWLAGTVEVDDDGQALLASADGEAFADVPRMVEAQPPVPAAVDATEITASRTSGGAGGEMER